MVLLYLEQVAHPFYSTGIPKSQKCWAYWGSKNQPKNSNLGFSRKLPQMPLGSFLTHWGIIWGPWGPYLFIFRPPGAPIIPQTCVSIKGFLLGYEESWAHSVDHAAGRTGLSETTLTQFLHLTLATPMPNQHFCQKC